MKERRHALIGGWLRRTVGQLLQLDDTPHRIALAFGIGLWLAFFPILGIHTILGLLIAFLFRLNRPAILAGIYVSNPWTLAPLYMAGTLVGCQILGLSSAEITSVDWHLHGRAFYRALFENLRPYVWPFVVGNTVLGVVGGIVGYVVLREILERRRAGAAATAPTDQAPPEGGVS